MGGRGRGGSPWGHPATGATASSNRSTVERRRQCDREMSGTNVRTVPAGGYLRPPPRCVVGSFGGRNSGGGAAGPVISPSPFSPHSVSVYSLLLIHTSDYPKNKARVNGAAHVNAASDGEGASCGVNSSEAAGRILMMISNKVFWRPDGCL